jgi:hypothetical protein
MSDTPKCEQCGLEITTGMMAALCPQARNCCMWPRSDGSPEADSAELLFAKFWMDNACEQIGLQIADRKRLAEYAERIAVERDHYRNGLIRLRDIVAESPVGLAGALLPGFAKILNAPHEIGVASQGENNVR